MLEITCIHNNEQEQHVAAIISAAVEKYNLPLFTEKIQIETMSIPHSHPVLTLNTRVRENEPKNIEVFVHEQFHRFLVQHPKREECIRYLKENYTDLGDCNKSGKNPNSFWDHLVVCRNTRNIISKIFDQNIVDEDIYGGWLAYPLTEAFVKEHFEKIREDLYTFDMICDYTMPL